jgi:carboxyl-terminal processing protease
MPKIAKIMLLAVSVALVLTVFLGVNANGVSAASNDDGGAYRQINVYTEVLQHIQQDYVTTPDITTVTDGALRGLLASLDADSSYLNAADYKTYKDDKGGKAQVGINISKRYGGYATVISVVPGSAADKAGLVDGDILEGIEGKDTQNISLAMIRLMLEGAPGSTLTVGLVGHNGKPEPEAIVMTRELTVVPPVVDVLPQTAEQAYANAGILYLKPEILDHDHVQQVEAKLKEMQKLGDKKVLLDLRDVAAGDMAEAMRMANFFMKDGVIATLEGQKFPKQVFSADKAVAVNTAAPVVVLVNQGTAGPAEVVAAALEDDKRAEVVGEKTFGEGAQQKTFEMPDGSALILTVAKYASPLGRKLQDDGVTPEVMLESPLDMQANVDADTVQAQAAAKPTAGGAKTPTATIKIVQPDEQLNKALDILKAKAA